jgi:hypothetical protein
MFLSLMDMGCALPVYEEIPVTVSMTIGHPYAKQMLVDTAVYSTVSRLVFVI